MTCRVWHEWQGKNGMAWIMAKTKAKKKVKKSVTEM